MKLGQSHKINGRRSRLLTTNLTDGRVIHLFPRYLTPSIICMVRWFWPSSSSTRPLHPLLTPTHNTTRRPQVYLRPGADNVGRGSARQEVSAHFGLAAISRSDPVVRRVFASCACCVPVLRISLWGSEMSSVGARFWVSRLCDRAGPTLWDEPVHVGITLDTFSQKTEYLRYVQR